MVIIIATYLLFFCCCFSAQEEEKEEEDFVPHTHKEASIRATSPLTHKGALVYHLCAVHLVVPSKSHVLHAWGAAGFM